MVVDFFGKKRIHFDKSQSIFLCVVAAESCLERCKILFFHLQLNSGRQNWEKLQTGMGDQTYKSQAYWL